MTGKPGRISLLLGFLLALGPAVNGSSEDPPPADSEPPKNGSEVRVIDPEDEEDFVLLCAGLQAYGYELVTIGLHAADLERAVPCVPGDFDGNGYFDFAIWGPRQPEDAGLPGTRQFKILYFQEGRILKSQQIETPGCDHLWLFGQRSEQDDSGAPLNPYDGLLQMGEGKTVFYYVYDDERGILKRIEWPEPGAAGAASGDQ